MEPMLATKCDITAVTQNNYLCQPKLNGIRAIWDPESKTLLTRNGNTIKSVEHIVDQLKSCNFNNLPLDGEIFTNKVSFQRLNGLVRRQQSSNETLILKFHVFDIAIKEMLCENRVSLLDNLNISSYIKKVTSIEICHKSQIRNLYKQYLNQGFEGIILREKQETYFPGRTRALLKIKPVMDMEAKLIGFAPAKEYDSKNSNTFGSLILQLDNGLVFQCGGLTAHDRTVLWAKKPLGADVTFRYGALSDNGIPVFPRYSNIRWDI